MINLADAAALDDLPDERIEEAVSLLILLRAMRRPMWFTREGYSAEVLRDLERCGFVRIRPDGVTAMKATLLDRVKQRRLGRRCCRRD